MMWPKEPRGVTRVNDGRPGRWKAGDPIIIKNVWQDRVLYAEPVTVVEDTGDRLVVFTKSGTPTKWSWVDWDTGAFDGPRDHVWSKTDVLKIVEPGRGYSIWLMWEENGGPFLQWYVNLQEPFVRTASGIVTWDLSLDIVVDPDRRWAWKDEDDFRRIQTLGWIAPGKAAEIREAGEGVIQMVDRQEEPFREPWPSWRPDRAWSIPEMPADWDDPGA